MKKRILIGTVNLEIGGIERTLIGLLKNIDYTKYDVDLLLLKTDGELVSEAPSNVNIITPYKSNMIKRIANTSNTFLKIIKHLLFNYFTAKLWIKNIKYDAAISYSGYYPFIDSYIMNSNSDKKLIWVHTNLNYFYKNNKFYNLRFKITKNK